MTLIDKVQTAIENIQDDDLLPVFRYGDLQEVENDMNILNRVLTFQENKFPFVYMNTIYDENELIDGVYYETDLTLWIIGRSEVGFNTMERHEDEMPALRTIRDSIRNEVRRFGEYDNIQNTEYFLTKNQTEFESPVNVIKQTFRGLKYQLNC